jgi:hypothetical protein
MLPWGLNDCLVCGFLFYVWGKSTLYGCGDASLFIYCKDIDGKITNFNLNGLGAALGVDGRLFFELDRLQWHFYSGFEG